MVIDEVGPMELEGSGWLESLESLQTSSIPVQLWNVREPLIAEVAEKWDIPGHCIIHIDKAGVNQAGGMIAEEVKKQRIKNQAIQ
jgi:nucleoside-triphosphatase THEP1